MAEKILLPVVTAIVAGVILLIIEYRTAWFQKHLLRRSKVDDSPKAPFISAPKALDVLGKSVTPVNELSSPVGDWLQIAREVHEILEEVYCQEFLEQGDYIPRVELVKVKPIKKSNSCNLEFDLTTNFKTGAAYVTVDALGRIVEFVFEYY